MGKRTGRKGRAARSASRGSSRRREEEPAAEEVASTEGPQKNDYGTQITHERTIAEWRYRVDLYPAEEGFGHIPLLLDLASGPAGAAVELIGSAINMGSVGESRIEGAGLSEALSDLAAVIYDVEGAEKVKELLRYTEVCVNGSWRRVADEFNTWGQGRYPHVLRVLAFVLEVNFYPFSGGGGLGILSRLIQSKPLFKEKFGSLLRDLTSETKTTSTSESQEASNSTPS